MTIQGRRPSLSSTTVQLEDKDLLYELSRIRNLEMIFIANEETELFAQLDERVRGRLQPGTRISFALYSHEELGAIPEIGSTGGSGQA